MPLNQKNVRWWLEKRVGYGNLRAKVWLLGIEERCENQKEIPVRLQPRRRVSDLRAYHLNLARRLRSKKKPVPLGKKIESLFLLARPHWQPTWHRLICFLWGLKGKTLPKPENDGKMRQYQANLLGRLRGETLLAEILPLPAKNSGHWPQLYKNLSKIAALRTRPIYEKAYLPKRAALIQKLAKKYKPALILAYGKKTWRPGSSRELDNGAHILLADVPTLLTPHPIYGPSRKVWHAWGRRLRKELGNVL